VRDPELIGHARPNAPTSGGVHKMVMFVLPAPALILGQENVLLMMKVRRKRECVRPIAEQSGELRVFIAGAWRPKWHVHEEDNKSVIRNEAQVVSKKLELIRTVPRQNPRPWRLSAICHHEYVVENNEMYPSVVE
jgi:hypothetical protein